MRLGNLAKCQMPQPPTVEKFVEALHKVKSPSDEEDTLLGPIPNPNVAPPMDYRRARLAALNCFLDYMGVCAAHWAQHDSLDDCFLGWARWCIDATELYSTPEQQQVCVAARTEKAGANFRVRSMPVLSFRSTPLHICSRY
eukprot:EG_transcript_29214